MTSTHDQTATVDRELYDEVREDAYRLREQMRAVKAVVNQGEPDYLASVYAASQLVYALLALPETRPDSPAAQHVAALSEQLCEILDALKAERPEQYKAEHGDVDHAARARRMRARLDELAHRVEDGGGQ